MRKITKSVITAGAAMVLIGCGQGILCAQDREAAVKDRQATMKAQAAAMAGVKKYLEGDVDQGVAIKNVDDLVKIAQSLPDKFASKDTSTTDFPGKSGAKPIIWTDWDKFLDAQKNMVNQAEKLTAAVKNGDKRAAADQFATTGKEGCGGCHSTYREKLS